MVHFCQKLQKYSYFWFYKTDTWMVETPVKICSGDYFNKKSIGQTCLSPRRNCYSLSKFILHALTIILHWYSVHFNKKPLMLERRGILSNHRNWDIGLHCDLQEHFSTTSILVPPLNGWDILDMVSNTNQSINQRVFI